MEARSRITVRARDRVCPGCKGVGGSHRRMDCAYLRDEIQRETRALKGRKAGA